MAATSGFQLRQSPVHRLRALDGLLPRLQLPEDADVGTGNERGASANQDDRVRGRVVAGSPDGLADRFGNTGAERIHRRVVGGDHGNAVAHFVPDQL
jgi:hypothetical protein